MHISMVRKYYFINKFDTNILDKQDKQTSIIFRNYSKSNQDESLIIDLRDSESFNAGHITASINIPLKDLSRRTNEIDHNEKSIILVCETGSASTSAGETLKKEGYKDICILRGGINQWKVDNLPLV